ncbi:MAG: arsenosugar biosynthesis radical SAM (seleno)protein ArsS [Dehalococcoidia bacterium]
MSDAVKDQLNSRQIEDNNGGFDFVAVLVERGLEINPISVTTLQLNITRHCNQACAHCHVEGSPNRTESMERPVIERCLEILSGDERIKILDITGGAPELHPEFRELVERAVKSGKKVMVRHNLTVMFEDKTDIKETKESLPEFFARNRVEVIASLPHYQEFFTDRQRGVGVFKKSVAALQLLNKVGYGHDGSGLVLNLVYNPAGFFIPASQASLEADFRRELLNRHSVVFNHLFAITNMPINRFRGQLERSDSYGDYMLKLKGAFNPTAALNAMCRSQISVDYQGRVYDCDFNQALGLQSDLSSPMTVFNFNYDQFLKRRIVFGAHCFGCTAGAGSSCGGATT